jgi:hypothetical protein
LITNACTNCQDTLLTPCRTQFCGNECSNADGGS